MTNIITIFVRAVTWRAAMQLMNLTSSDAAHKLDEKRCSSWTCRAAMQLMNLTSSDAAQELKWRWVSTETTCAMIWEVIRLHRALGHIEVNWSRLFYQPYMVTFECSHLILMLVLSFACVQFCCLFSVLRAYSSAASSQFCVRTVLLLVHSFACVQFCC